MAAGAAISIVYAAVGYWILLTREERTLAWRMVPLADFMKPSLDFVDSLVAAEVVEIGRSTLFRGKYP